MSLSLYWHIIHSFPWNLKQPWPWLGSHTVIFVSCSQARQDYLQDEKGRAICALWLILVHPIIFSRVYVLWLNIMMNESSCTVTLVYRNKTDFIHWIKNLLTFTKNTKLYFIFQFQVLRKQMMVCKCSFCFIHFSFQHALF